MKNPTQSGAARTAPRTTSRSTAHRQERPRYETPTVLTYTREQILKEAGPRKRSSGLHPDGL
jgi:hypothetical protein